MTSLPLIWGEGDIAAQIAGRAPRATVFDALHPLPIDVLTPATLGAVDVVVLAQPRALGPGELVALDDWVRRGGRALIFADPALTWPSAYPLGDRRRGIAVTLLDPLLDHWGLTLGPADDGERRQRLGAFMVSSDRAGGWTAATTQCRVVDPLTASCRIGRGRALLVGDADVLDTGRADAIGADNRAWVAGLVSSLIGQPATVPDQQRWWWLTLLVPLTFVWMLWNRKRT